MSFWLRAVVSIVLGGAIAWGLIQAADSPALSQSTKDVLLWNVGMFVKLAGERPIMSYDPSSGKPRYEGTPEREFFGTVGLVSTFPIYMMFSFLLLTIGNHILRKKPTNGP